MLAVIAPDSKRHYFVQSAVFLRPKVVESACDRLSTVLGMSELLD
jgi:hypothetical protein